MDKKEILDDLKRRLNPKDISVIVRRYEGPFRNGRYKLSPHKDICEPAESYYFELNKPIGLFNNEYPQLSRDGKKSKKEIYLIEIIIEFEEIKVSAGFDWLIIGELNNEKRFCAVIYVFVKDIFRKLKISSLLKNEEIKLAKEKECDFIQTWHYVGIEDFVGAIIPSLNNEFVLYHGGDDIEHYENIGYIHLRKIFKKKDIHQVKVNFKDGNEFISPNENYQIKEYLLKLSNKNKYPGKQIKLISEYGKKI